MDVYDRFPLQSFELFDGMPQSLKFSVIKSKDSNNKTYPMLS